MRTLLLFAVAATVVMVPFSAYAGRCPVTQKWDERHASAVAGKVANGHAWRKHAGEYYGTKVDSVTKFKALVEKIITGAGAGLGGGRHKWWDGQSGTFVVFNPRDHDCGTAFKPTAGKSYHDNQR